MRESPSARGPARRTEPVPAAPPLLHVPRQSGPRLGPAESRPRSKGRKSDRGGSRDVISSTLTRLTARVTSASPPGRRSRPYASPRRRHHSHHHRHRRAATPDPTCAALSDATLHASLTSPSGLRHHCNTSKFRKKHVSSYYFVFRRPIISFPPTRRPNRSSAYGVAGWTQHQAGRTELAVDEKEKEKHSGTSPPEMPSASQCKRDCWRQ